MMLAFSSCGKDDKKKDPTANPGDLPYSKLPPEKQKEKLADEANAFLSAIQDMNKEKSVEVFEAFGNLLNIDAPVIGGGKLGSSGDIIKINQFYGKFTWQPSTQTWKEEPSNQLEFNFPVGSSQGRIVITGVSSGKNYTYEEYYDGDWVCTSWDEEYGYCDGGYWDENERVEKTSIELPKQLSAKLYLGGSEVGSIQVDADIVSADSAPNSVKVSFNFGSYKFTESYEKSTGKVTASFKKGNNELINISAGVKGNIDDLIEYGSDDFTGNFAFRIMNDLAFAGDVDFGKYGKEMDALDDKCYPYPYPPGFDWDKAEENYTKGSVDIWNKYFNVYLISIKEGTKIAKLIKKADSVTNTHQWYDYVYNPETDDYDMVMKTSTYTYWDEVYVLKFNDSTEIEADVYFSEGFSTVIKNFEKFIQSFE
jgi:hypothetical protein